MRRACIAMARVTVGFSTAQSIFCASSASLSLSKSKPLRPFLIIYGTPPTLDEMTNRPAFMASKSDTGILSTFGAERSTSEFASWRNISLLSTRPVKVTLRSPISSAIRTSSACSEPSPTGFKRLGKAGEYSEALYAAFHQPHYLLLNLAIGGDNGGEPDPTDYPMRYEIDYVRIYQLK